MLRHQNRRAANAQKRRGPPGVIAREFFSLFFLFALRRELKDQRSASEPAGLNPAVASADDEVVVLGHTTSSEVSCFTSIFDLRFTCTSIVLALFACSSDLFSLCMNTVLSARYSTTRSACSPATIGQLKRNVSPTCSGFQGVVSSNSSPENTARVVCSVTTDTMLIRNVACSTAGFAGTLSTTGTMANMLGP